MAIAIALRYVGDDLRSINRCRLACCCIFLSCVAGANGRYLDPLRGQPGIDYSASSTFTFVKEKPSNNDWAVWCKMWHRYCLPDGSLPRALGKWIHQSHRRREWYYHPQVDILVQHTGNEMWKYCSCPRKENAFSTRNSHIFGRVGHWLPAMISKAFFPATVRYGAEVVLLGSGPPLRRQQDCDPEEFWGYLHSLGGEWLRF
jgi:hypothetical protein